MGPLQARGWIACRTSRCSTCDHFFKDWFVISHLKYHMFHDDKRLLHVLLHFLYPAANLQVPGLNPAHTCHLWTKYKQYIKISMWPLIISIETYLIFKSGIVYLEFMSVITLTHLGCYLTKVFLVLKYI